MRVLIAHNRYQQRGGEDVVVDNESAMLSRAGHDVECLTVSNDDITGLVAKVRTAFDATRNAKSAGLIANRVRAFRPDVVHFHNTFPQLGPGAVDAALKLGIPTVQTLHNFRLVCANAQFLRNGRICEDCLAGSRLPGILRRCYRGSVVGSAVIARVGRRFRAIYDRNPHGHTLIVLNAFAKSKLVKDGYHPARIAVKGNTTPDRRRSLAPRERRIVFVGRLASEKGAELLLAIARSVDATFEIIGDGPERARLAALAGENVVMRGWMDHEAVLQRIATAAAVAVPSLWFEGFPVVVAEAMASGTPLLVSALGALPELVEDGVSGRVLPPGDSSAWAAATRELLDRPGLAARFGAGARAAYDRQHSESANLAALVEIYETAIDRKRASRTAGVRATAGAAC